MLEIDVDPLTANGDMLRYTCTIIGTEILSSNTFSLIFEVICEQGVEIRSEESFNLNHQNFAQR